MAICLLAAAAPGTADAFSFSQDFETGSFAPMQEGPESGSGIQIVSGGETFPSADSGSKMVKSEVTPGVCWTGDEESGSCSRYHEQFRLAPFDHSFRDGEETWLAYSLYLDRVPTGDGSFFSLGDWHAPSGHHPCQAPLNWGLTADSEGVRRVLMSRVSAGTNCDTATDTYGKRVALTLKKWHRLLIHVEWSKGSDGLFEMFLDGSSAPFSSISGRNILDSVTAGGHAADWNYLKMGVYVGAELGEQSPRVFIDQVRLGTSRAEVEGGSASPPPPSPSPPSPPVSDPVSNLQAGDVLDGTVQWRVEAPEGAQSVEFWADDERLYVDSAAPFEFALDTRTMTNGRHELGLAWTDANGRRHTPQIGAVTVENAESDPGGTQPPPKPVSNLEAGDTLTGVVQWIVEAPAGAQSVEFWADDERLHVDSAGPFQLALDTRTMTNGPHQLGLAWTDAVGERRTPQIGAVTVENAEPDPDGSPPPPEPVSNLQAGDVLDGTVPWRVEAPEGAQSVEFWADDERLYVDSTAPFEFALDTRTMTNGWHELGLAWTDANGRRHTPQIGTVKVKNSPIEQNADPT